MKIQQHTAIGQKNWTQQSTQCDHFTNLFWLSFKRAHHHGVICNRPQNLKMVKKKKKKNVFHNIFFPM